ncbi:hypothetical protein ACQP06_13945 [Nocardia sp. CA-136227]|uniref:hypothetical protein n=1 Tax=Nocardia sp. CA-136227 TaxID=3239979 RepID=UPI003D99C73D
MGESELIAHSSFFQRDLITKKRAAGLPVQLIAHEDVLVLEKVAGQRNTGIISQDWAA